jgi:hypothetical protein
VRSSRKLGALFLVYLLAFPVILDLVSELPFGDILSAQSQAATVLLIILFAPIVVLPVTALALELRDWLEKDETKASEVEDERRHEH